MKEDSVERLFLASLRQALEDIAPEQLEVFQKWFDPADRRPRFHIAPVMAAVSYLSRDPALYEKVMDRAGRYASDWELRASVTGGTQVMELFTAGGA